jgi:hypothetical protein
MLLLFQSYVTYQQFPRGGEIVTRPPEYVEDTDEDMLVLWFALLRSRYEANRNSP